MSGAAKGCLRAVLLQADACEKIVRDFLDRQPCREILDKVLWTTKGPREMVELRRKLSVHRETMSILLEMYAEVSTALLSD
jgi:hypothetical protein